ncbi:hypothetical protein K378_00956 [Streptomyces sp. Amel2xB2]|nr:hypothetical protein K378_00956 [Streptomyces sp. Amel2xB2]
MNPPSVAARQSTRQSTRLSARLSAAARPRGHFRSVTLNSSIPAGFSASFEVTVTRT